MIAGSVVREWQFDQLRKAPTSFAHIVKVTPDADLRQWRDGGRGWTALEVLCHLRDFDDVFVERARVTLREQEGRMPFPNPDELAVERRYNAQSVQEVLLQWAVNRRRLLDLLKPLPESQWERTAQHPKRGLMSLQDQLALIAWHDMNHLEQMTRLLDEKRK